MTDRTLEYKIIADTQDFNKNVVDSDGKVKDLDKTTQDLNKNTQESFDKSIAKLRDVSLAYDGLKNAVNDIVAVFSTMSNESEDAVAAEFKSKSNALESPIAPSVASFMRSFCIPICRPRPANLLIASPSTTVIFCISSECLFILSRVCSLSSNTFFKATFNFNSAMKLVANGFEQNYDMLGRYIPSIKNATTETEKAALFNKVLADGFSFAKAETDTFRGAIEQLKNKIGDLKENFGSLINNIILPLVKLLDNDLVLASGVAITTMTALAVPVYALTTAFTALSAAVTASTGGLNLVIAAIAAAGVGVATYAVSTKEASEQTKQFATELDNLKNSINKLSEEQLQKSADEIMTLTHGYDIVISKKQEQLAKIIEGQKKADAQNDQLNFNRLDNEKQLIQQSIDFQIERKKSLLDQLVVIDNQQSENTKVKLKELTEAEIKAAQEAADKKLELEKQYYIDLLEAEQNYKDQRDAMKETLPELAPEGAGIAKSEYTPEMQLADQQIADELLLEEARVFSAQILDIDTATHEARLQALANEKISYDQYQSLELESKAKTEKAKQALNKQTALNGAKDMLANLQALKSLGKDAAAVAKAAAIASTTIDTIDSAQKSYKWGASWGGPFGGAAMAAIALAAGYARVAQITATATGFQSGGYTGTGQDDEVAGVAHKNEVIIPAPVVRKIGIDRAISIAAGVASVPDFAGSETGNGLNNISGRLGALNANIVNQDSVKETFIINNSDFVEITKEIEKTKSNHPGIMDNKYLGAF